ncbi:MAG TPA: xanthine dehydrogenase small subunit [Geminicoccaceae bacterium]
MAEAVRFLLGHEPRELRAVAPNLTVLNYLREVERRTGTKEGCAEGDCGACTVVLGELQGDRIRYRAVNACILFTPQLDGKQLITVEHLRRPDGSLHPVQQAMVECHGSQCGFCTPGFVMALFALYHSEGKPNRQRILDVLAGNLCRCTGYRPIIDAALRMYDLGEGDQFSEREVETIEQLRALADGERLGFAHDGKRYFAPRRIDELAALCEQFSGACLLAGGTDVALWVTKQHRDLDTLIYVGAVEELKRLRATDTHLEIGAAVTYTDAMGGIVERWPDFGELIRRLGSVQIRNAGTIGGNIANGSPIGDSMPALIALGAELVLRKGAAHRVMPLEDFYLGYRQTGLAPGEFLELIRVPLPGPGQQFRCYKIAKRFDQDISALLGAFRVAIERGRVADVRIAFGGMAAIPKRAGKCEGALRGRPWSAATIARGRAALAGEFAPISDMRASAAYRLLVAQNLLTKFFIETSAPSFATRVLEIEAPHA